MYIRTFANADFEPIARLLGTMWHSAHGAQSYWQGADELCDHLAQSDQGFVAVDAAGDMCGVVLLAGPNPATTRVIDRAYWLRKRERLQTEAAMLGIDSRADVAYLDEENELMERIGKQLETAGVGEVVLLAVDERRRGAGLGRALWNTGIAWLADQAAHTARLITDDGCDWGFYEHLGLRRVLSDVFAIDDTCGVYVYECNLTSDGQTAHCDQQ